MDSTGNAFEHSSQADGAVELGTPLPLPCGAVLPNRLAKSAMTEGLAGVDGRANEKHVRLYRLWGAGGTGLLLSGNIQVDVRSLERPGNVRIEGSPDRDQLEGLRTLARAGTAEGAHFWAQIAHAGRQAVASACPSPVAPSELPVPDMPRWRQLPARSLTEVEIQNIIGRFGNAARVCREAEFSGVQIHGAHGYLVSQFLSPLTNHRDDDWGGTLENRARFLLEILRAVRRAVGPDFPVSLKMNSADFQQGGFTHEESMEVVHMLNLETLDLLEITGGTYEQLSMLGVHGETGEDRPRPSTVAREAYFAEYSADARRIAKMPVLATGGFRRRDSMLAALNDGVADMIGLARPLVTDPSTSRKLIEGKIEEADRYEDVWQLDEDETASLDAGELEVSQALGPLSLFYMLLFDMGDGVKPDMTRPLATAQAQLSERDAEIGAEIRARFASGNSDHT
jgi:2,4-dienoyl-CoA reductase-like NADH-dependent reductase (Old Yellow Enzyme family)